MGFQLLVEGRPRPAQLMFAKAQELHSISHWRAPTGVTHGAAVRDSIEFARMASKRHRYYARSIPTVASIKDFQEAIAETPQAEVALMLLARASWFARSPILGFAQCRRTYCHHLVLEFLAVHPAIVGGMVPRVSGVGKGLLCGLAELAVRMGVELVWGEATALSASFYSHVLANRRIADCFFIRGQALARCRQEFREEFFGELDWIEVEEQIGGV